MSASLANSPALPIPVASQTESRHWPGVEFRVSREDISAGVDWTIREPRHAVIVHLQGHIHRLETELEGCGAALDPPMAGEVWLIPAGQSYASQARGGVVRYAELYLEPDALTALRPRAGRYDEFLHQSVRYLAPLLAQTDDLSQMIGQSLTQTLRLHVLRHYGDSPAASIPPQREPGLTASTAKRLQEFIAAHLGEHLTLEALAQLAQLTTHQLLRAFRRTFGTTPAQYVIEQRLRRARWLLTTGSMDITAVALETGFASHSHFTTTFKAHLGLTPREFCAAYRRSCKDT
jgi:AraC family transcriptional regulator